MSDDFPRLRTPRLLLRPWREDDKAAFWRMNADPEVTRHLLPVPDRRDSDARADSIIQHFTDYGFGLWVVEIAGIHPFAGFTGLRHVPYQASFTPAVEIAWRFDRTFWNHGYATEAARACLDYGFNVLKQDEIVAVTRPDNKRSRAVMTRLGMTHAQMDDFELPLPPEQAHMRPHVLYRMAREQHAGREAT